MNLAVLGAAVLLLLILIARFKLNAFLALIVTSFLVGVANGMEATAALQSILKGIGDTMGSILLVLVFGAILGKLIEESGAAHRISAALTKLFGARRIQLSVLITGFLVGLPMIYNASFLVLIPLIYTLSSTTGLPLMYLGIPLSAALSVTHGYLPPHPAPTTIAAMYKADVNLTLLYGLALAVPAVLLAGPVLARFFRKLKNMPPPELHQERAFREEDLPGLCVSLFITLLPVLLMLTGAIVAMLASDGGAAARTAKFLGDPNLALCLAVFAGLYTLGVRRGRDMDSLMKSCGAAAAGIGMVILIIAAGGAFKQVLLDSGTGEEIKNLLLRTPLSPLLLAWGAAALLRLALGSATVAAITAAGIVLPMVPTSGVAPELLVIATAAGSLMFSHFNDIGFWMFKEYYNVSIRQTFQIWTVMESIVAIVGLVGVLGLNLLARPAPARAASKRAFYVNSYHEGYPSSDASMAAIRRAMASSGVELRTFLLDSKRHPLESEIKARAAEAVRAIRAFRPDVLVASDDDALKYVVAPDFRNGPLPVVFCGVNWSSEQYNLSPAHVTGILEQVPIEETLRDIRRAFADVRRLRILSEDSTSERNNGRILEGRYRALGFEPSYALVGNFTEWQKEFARAQVEADAVYLPTNGAIQGWDKEEARAWVRRHLRKPVVTCDDFMMPYAMYGLTKAAEEQGEWAAEAALAVLSAKRVAEIPVAVNRRTRCYVNPELARQAGFTPPRERACTEYSR